MSPQEIKEGNNLIVKFLNWPAGTGTLKNGEQYPGTVSIPINHVACDNFQILFEEDLQFHSSVGWIWPVAKRVMDDFAKITDPEDYDKIASHHSRNIRFANQKFEVTGLFKAVILAIKDLNKINKNEPLRV